MSRLLVLSATLFVLLLILPPPAGEAGKLSEDGRAGIVLDVQGTALLRPAGHERWTPLAAKSVLYPGDLLRTSARGAHALEFQMKNGRVLLGPSGWIEMAQDGSVRLLSGEIEATGSKAAPLSLRGPGAFTVELSGSAWLRAKGSKTVQLEERPRWIRDYRASASDEWMGSLLAQVDGRDVPLAVGYHKVDVEVRDQIARTTVEQSFINTTSSRLEGVFHFPLPADASISGFGMWIGDELVEADIVERQRARQIYEDILRRKKDPGLLEWEGGNIFKARVFPIEAHSEKRIRIRYTQVLPMQKDGWRYRYALRSELLRSKPLRELRLTVRIVSEAPMVEVSSPTHEVTVHDTGHEATVEFMASEYRPEKDFEVAVRLDTKQALTTIAHRRGEDGYFMLLLSPPDPQSGSWRRELAPEGKPLDIILLADTSGSIDEGARSSQATFLAALLELLSEKDRFRLAACDVDTTWMVDAPTAPTAENIDRALDLLAKRRSLGWTDLDHALSNVLAEAGEGTLVVYIGDGVGTTGDADPVALAERLRVRGRKSKASVHAVAPSSSYEAPVLEALAGIGGGSMRPVGAYPARSAFALLAEAARPAVRDIKVEIDGLRTARVYPRRLPNLPLGSQQVLLGRFLPTAGDQVGRVTVTGQLAGKPVRYSTDLRLAAAEEGNAFLPRLWGRRHIDALLAEGRSPQMQEEIVAFSERFGIMTPYTSFLVLESDEDRERYGVARRVRMRDGERFFADARDRATLEKRRDLMKAAGRWRLQLRSTMLREIARLGRDLPIALLPAPANLRTDFESVVGFGYTSYSGRSGGLPPSGGGAESGGLDDFRPPSLRSSWGPENSEGGRRLGLVDSETRTSMDGGERRPSAPPSAAPTSPAAKSPAPRRRSRREKKSEAAQGDVLETDADLLGDEVMEAESIDLRQSINGRGGGAGGRFAGRSGRRSLARVGESLGKRLRYNGRPRRPAPFTLQSLGFPYVPKAPTPSAEGALEPWSEEVLTLLRSLPRRAAIAGLEGGLHFVFDRHAVHATRQTNVSGYRSEAWLGASRWLMKSGDEAFAEPAEQWVAAGQRGALAGARRLARTRKAVAEDGRAWSLPLWDMDARDVIATWRRQRYRATIVSREGDHVVVKLQPPGQGAWTRRLLIDTARRVIVEDERLDARGQVLRKTIRADFVEVAGRFWARRTEVTDQKDRVVQRATLQIESLDKEALEAVLKRAAVGRADAITVEGKLPSRTEAKQALHEKRGTFLDHLIQTIIQIQAQRAEEALEAWTAAELLVKDKAGARYLRAEVLRAGRRGEALKTYLSTLLPDVLRQAGAGRRFLVGWMHRLAQGTLGARERGLLLDNMREAWIDAGQAGEPQRRRGWMSLRAAAYDQAGMQVEARAMRKSAAERYPFGVPEQLSLEADLWTVGRYEPALALLTRLLTDREPWLDQERDQIYTRLSDRLWDRRRLKHLHEVLLAWSKFVPENATPYLRLFSSFYFRGETEAADAVILGELKTRLQPPATRAAWARQTAAVQLALGQGWNFNINHIEPAWTQPLADLCLYMMRLEGATQGSARTIFQNRRFRRTNEYAQLRKQLYADVGAAGAVARMSPERLARYIGWLDWGRNAVDAALWQSTADQLRARWTETEDARLRAAVGQHVLRLLDAHGEREEAIRFVRTRWKRAATEDASGFANDLFRRLLATPYRDEHATPPREDECFGLLGALSPADAASLPKKARSAQAVRKLADRLYRWRFEAGIGTPEERAKLSRAARKTLRREVRQQVRGEVAKRLAQAEETAPLEARPWLRIEHLGYGAEAGLHMDVVQDAAGAILQADWERKDLPLDRLMRERAAVILSYVAVRRGASAATVDSALAIFRAGQKSRQAALAKDAKAVELLDWRYQTFRLLVALDRAKALEAALREWIVPAHVESRWRIALAYLLAETGRLPEAAEQFEAVHQLGELSAEDYARLSDWYLVLGNDEKRANATAARYDHMNENQLSSLLWSLQPRRGRGPSGVPEDMDTQIFQVLETLMRKAHHPGNYWYRLRNLYRQTKDFRMLECISDALAGHTKEAIYGFLGQLGTLTREIHEEATCDALTRRLETLIGETTKPLDRRAFLLALALVEGRASLVPDTDPAHGARALTALQRAFKEDWEEGEAPLMAAFLQRLGRVVDASTQAEQFRQLEALLSASESGTPAQLQIALALAQTSWVYDQKDQALAVLEVALAESRKANQGRVPMQGNNAFDTQVNWLAQLGRFGAAERVLQAETERWDLPWRRQGLRRRLFTLYVDALKRGGSVSLGRGMALFDGARVLMQTDMDENPAGASASLNSFCSLHRAAQEAGVAPDAGKRLERFARTALSALLERVPLNASNYATIVAGTIRKLSGARAGLSFLLDRTDAEPTWLVRVGADTWQHSVYNLARWRKEAGDISALEERLLALVTAHLEKELLNGGQRSGGFWNRGNKWFWAARAQAFADVAGKVVELNETNEAVVVRAASLLYRNLGRPRAGIAVLQAAHGRSLLGLAHRWTLTQWLIKHSRWAEALPLAEALVRERADTLEYRVAMAKTLSGLKRKDEAAAALDATEAHWREGKRWSERPAATLGRTAAQLSMATRAERWMEEAIRLRQEARGGRGGRDGTLARYYRELATARALLGKTGQAVSAAATAILSTHPNNRSEMNKSRAALDRAFASAPSLAAYVKDYEAQVQASGMDAPLIRKALAAAFAKRGDHKARIRQLLAARDLDAGDAQIHTALVQAYDKQRDAAAALEALFGSIRLAPHNLEAYEDLERRYRAAGDTRSAERALTSLVEASPHQAAGHRRLAQRLQKLDRWPAALMQWQQVVRTEKLDPTGWLALAAVHVRLKQPEPARRALEHVLSGTWEERFGKPKQDAAKLLQGLGN